MSVSKTLVSGFFRGTGRFRELLDASRNHFHLSWYLADAAVISYGEQTWESSNRVLHVVDSKTLSSPEKVKVTIHVF